MLVTHSLVSDREFNNGLDLNISASLDHVQSSIYYQDSEDGGEGNRQFKSFSPLLILAEGSPLRFKDVVCIPLRLSRHRTKM